MSDSPAFLVLKFPPDTPETTISNWTNAISAARGTVLAAATADRVTPLEAGSAHEALILARFAVAPDLDRFWTSRAGDAPPGLIALSADGLPWEGWPGNFVPTIATVTVPDEGTRAYMLIEGTGHDDERLDRYRDIILPMLRERGAYYVLFSLGGTTRVLAGEWSEAVFAISRWPSLARAEEFWFSQTYQQSAIPIRTGVSRFDVQIVEVVAG